MENKEENMKTYEKPDLEMNEISLDDVVLSSSQIGDIGELDVFKK